MKGQRNLQHGDESRDGTDEADTGLEARGSAIVLGGSGRRDGVAGGGGLEGLRDGHGASGLDDAGGGSAAGRSGADRGRNVDGGGGGAVGGALDGRGNLVGAGRDSGGLDGITVLGGLDSGSRGSGGGLDGGAGLLYRGVVLDTELSGVLVVAIDVIDELDSPAVGAVSALEGGGGSPGVAASVGDTLNDDGVDLAETRLALEEDQGDRVGRVSSPGDGEGLASGDGLGGVC